MKLRVSNPGKGTLLCAIADIAQSDGDRRRGLLGRYSFQPGEGLWISPCDSIHTYGMQFPIDVAFLDGQGLVMDVLENVGPGGTAVRDGAASVLELPAGTLKRTMTAAGDYLELATFEPARSIPTNCFGLLNLAEEYGLVSPGTTVAVSQLIEHGKRVRGAIHGVRG